MGSLTKQRKQIRKIKVRASGKARKSAVKAGTTPRFPVHVEEAPDAELPKPPGTHPAEQ